MRSEASLSFLEGRAKTVRKRLLEMVVAAGKGHLGGGLSCADLLVALYHGGLLTVDPDNPSWPDRDRFVFSKGHAAEVLYAVLADYGFFDESLLSTYGQNGSPLGGHVDRAVPGIEASTGSLGHGLGIGAGMALAARKQGEPYCTVVMLGDGECYEGSVWEAAMLAAQHRLSRLVAIVDRNRQITLDYTEDCNRLEPFADKWRAFGWEVAVINGHSFQEIIGALDGIRSRNDGPPIVIVADTRKGKGISFMEDQPGWHHGVPKGERLQRARMDLDQ